MMLWLLLFGVFFVRSAPPVVLTATKEFHAVERFGDKFRVGFFDITFDQDLYLIMSLGERCRVTTCEPNCPSCNYETMDDCNIPETNTSCGCKRESCVRKKKNGYGIVSYGLFDYRRDQNSPPTQKRIDYPQGDCLAVVYTVQPISYSSPIQFTLGLDTFLSGSFIRNYVDGYNIQSRTICPGFDPSGSFDFFVDPTYPYPFIFQLNIITKKIIIEPAGVACTLPSSLNQTHICLNIGNYFDLGEGDGVNYAGNISLRFAIPLPPNQCTTLTFGTDFYAIWTSLEDPFPDRTGDTSHNRTLYFQNFIGGSVNNFARRVCSSSEIQYFYVYAILGPSNFPRLFWVENSTSWVNYTSFDDILIWMYPVALQNTFTLNCGNNYYTNIFSNALDPQYQTYAQGGFHVRAMWPSDENMFFYPPPPFLSGFDYRYQQSLKDSEIPKKVPKRFRASVIFSWDLQSVELNFPKKISFMDESTFESCQLSFLGTITNKNGEALHTTITNITTLKRECDYTSYTAIVSKMTSILDSYQGFSDLETNVLADYQQMDILASSNEYLACYEFFEQQLSLFDVDSNYFVGYNTSECLHQDGTLEFDNDPCCNKNSSGCEVEMRYVSSPKLLDSQAIPSELEESCANSVCTIFSLSEIQSKELSNHDPENGCRNTLGNTRRVIETIMRRTYLGCYNQYFTHWLTGYPCEHDVDCAKFDGAKCSNNPLYVTANKRICLYNYSKMEVKFLECVIKTLPLLIVNQLKDKMNISESDKLTPQAIQNSSLFSDKGCYDPNDVFPSYGRVDNYYNCDPPDACFYLYRSSYYFLNMYSPNCGHCKSLATPASTVSYWCNIPRCNWIDCEEDFWEVTDQNCISGTVCLDNTSTHFCGLCENGFDCIKMDSTHGLSTVEETNQAQCEDVIMCAFADGTIRKVNSEDECTSSYSCTTLCNGSPCANEAACNVTGKCSDSIEDGYKGVNYIGIFTDGVTGLCRVKLEALPPFRQSIICAGGNSSLLPGGSLKHSRAGECLLILNDQSYCNRNYVESNLDGSIVLLTEDPEWITPAKNELQCKSYPKICFDVIDLTKSSSQFVDFRFGATESLCEGDYVDAFTWYPGRWLPGQVRRLSYREKVYEPRFIYEENVTTKLNFDFLRDTIYDAYSVLITVLARDALFCQYSTIPEILDGLVCNCRGKLSSETCKRNTHAVVAVIVICSAGEDNTTSKVENFMVITTPTSVTPDGYCYLVNFKTVSITRFQSNSVPPLTYAVVYYSEDTTFSLRNFNRGIFGKVLSDGLTIISAQPLYQFTIRFPVNPRDRSFPVLDIAYQSQFPVLGSGPLLIPMGLPVQIINGYYSVDIPEVILNHTYFFIERSTTPWNEVKRTVFSTGEVVYLSIILAMYTVGLLGSIFKIGFWFYKRGLIFVDRLLFILSTIFSFFTFRVVFISLLLANALLDSNNAVGFVLVEFPVLLYFIFVSNYVVIWAFLKRNSKKLSAMQQNFAFAINTVIITFNLFVFTLWILILILYLTIVKAPVYLCDGAVAKLDSSTAFALQIAYRATFSFIAIALGVSLLYTGYTFAQLMKKMHGVAPTKRYKILFVAVVGSLGLIAQAIDLLVITAGRFVQSNYISLSILIVVEIIPALLFLFMIDIKKSTAQSMKSTMVSGATSSKNSVTTRGGESGDDVINLGAYRD